MEKYEYKFLNYPSGINIAEVEDTLNDLGLDGWNLITVAGTSFIFKRLIVENISEGYVNEIPDFLEQYDSFKFKIN